jgi:hypothetical protein
VNVWRSLRQHRRLSQRIVRYPFATILSLTAIPVGALAIIVGPGVSRAFTIVYDQPGLIYVWGGVLGAGGVAVLLGILWSRPSIEMAGLFTLAPAFGFYGVSVIIGLGVGGLVTGPLNLGLALACVMRGINIWRSAGRPARVARQRE